MAPKSPELYSIKKTTIVFAIASVILTVSMVGMILQDNIRDWKGYQREFVTYSRNKAQADLEAAQKAINKNLLKKAQADLQKATEELKSKSADIKRLEKELARLTLTAQKIKTSFQNLKQTQDSDRYFFEEAEHHGNKKATEHYHTRLQTQGALLEDLKAQQEKMDAKVDAKQEEIDKIRESSKTANANLTKMTQDTTRLQTKIKSLSPGFFSFKWILDIPMLDFLKPSLRIQQVVLEDLYDDFYFAKSKKVDRCITCHLGIDQKAFDGAPVPFKSHPRLDLFLSSDSPHPLETFGCTTCHGGGGHSANFTTAAHTPRDEKQAEEWKKKYHWEDMHHAPEKMLPMNQVEASCAKCHQGMSEVPQAPKLNEGRKLAETYGCINCHKVAGMERWKVGPSLTHIQSKLEQDWIVRWLHNPKEFRPSTRMPRIFNLSNTSDPESIEKSNTAIAGVATYLIKNSDPVVLQPATLQGDKAKGKQLIEEVGCLGCHTIGGKSANHHGPELSGLGSKVSADWLFNWIKNPKHFSPQTRMPSLRLSDEEAANITSYLLSEKNQNFESIKLPRIEPGSVESMAFNFLLGEMRRDEAKKKLDEMNQEQRLELIGKKTIFHQGCFSCHDIKGFETTKPIGTELTDEGRKDPNKLDFGFIHLDHTRQAWFFQKLKEPRIFDQGKDKPYYDKLRMPQFDFTDAQAESLTTFLLSLQKSSIPLQKQRRLDSQDVKTEEGRLLVKKLNCQGCHTVDGKDGQVRSIIKELGNAPPILSGEGRKVQADWLFQFLHGPTPIRPWLKYRMPTFDFKDSEISTLIQYFQNIDHAAPEFSTPYHPDLSAEALAKGKSLFQTLQCIKCHKSNPAPGLTASFLAPDLLMAKSRLRPEWIVQWLTDPQTEMAGTMMPGFFPDGQSPIPNVLEGDATKQMMAIRDYLVQLTPEEGRINEQPAPSKPAQV